MADNGLLKHPAEYYLRFLLIKEPGSTNAELEKKLVEAAILTPDTRYYEFLRQKLHGVPELFDPYNRTHRPSMRYLREQRVMELFHPTPSTMMAYEILTNPQARQVVEQVLCSRMDLKEAASRINKQMNWHLTADGIELYGHFFWNVKLLSFDEWGRFLYGRSSLYERLMGQLQGNTALAMHHLRLEQTLDSKAMIRRAQEIAYFTLEEVNQKPGTAPDKVKAIGVLGKTIIECHGALSTSEMAMKDVLKEFEKFRMVNPEKPAVDILALAPGGNFSNSGVDTKEEDKVPR